MCIHLAELLIKIPSRLEKYTPLYPLDSRQNDT